MGSPSSHPQLWRPSLNPFISIGEYPVALAAPVQRSVFEMPANFAGRADRAMNGTFASNIVGMFAAAIESMFVQRVISFGRAADDRGEFGEPLK